MNRRQFIQAAAVAPLAASVTVRPTLMPVVYVDGRARQRLLGNSGTSFRDAVPTLGEALKRVAPGGTIFVANAHVECNTLNIALNRQPRLTLNLQNCLLST